MATSLPLLAFPLLPRVRVYGYPLQGLPLAVQNPWLSEGQNGGIQVIEAGAMRKSDRDRPRVFGGLPGCQTPAPPSGPCGLTSFSPLRSSAMRVRTAFASAPRSTASPVT